MNLMLTKNRVADAAINPYRLAKHGAADGAVLQAAGATDAICGVSGELGADTGERVDIHTHGIAEVEFGGTITRGQAVTADVNGKAVAATAPQIHQTVIAGGGAGNHTVTGIATTDTLISVMHLDATDASETAADLTAEFEAPAPDTIANVGGTDTTGGYLVVTYRNPAVRIAGFAEVSGSTGDIAEVLLAPGVLS